MKILFENWRKFLKEINSNERSFTFNKDQLQQLNNSIETIVSAAKKVLGAEGPIPHISPKDLEPVELTEPEQMKMVAEEEDNVISLRKKYHGPEGELKKHGPRAVRGLEKGLGHMTAQEFEESGYVLKVPIEVLKDFEAMVTETRKTTDLYEQARDWYHDIRELLDRETGSDRDATLLGLLIATYSPRAKFALNLGEAAFMYRAVQKDAASDPNRLKEYLETFPGAENFQPGQFRGFTNAHKVPNFALNLIAPQLAGHRDKETGQLIYDDMYKWNSTIDTWMIDAFYPSLKKSSTAKEWEAIKGKLMSNVTSYRYMSQLVAQEAKKLNLLPHELQAIVWVSMQIRQTGEAGLGVTTQFAFDQIKEAIVNIRTINHDLDSIRMEFEEKGWLGTLFDEIENKGFQEAGKFLLGIKNEKGKTVVPGVRSITSRGKKGAAFKYYAEEIEKTPTKKNKPEKRYADPKFKDLKTHYVMNHVIQMPTGKFNNLYDSITLYLDPGFSTKKAVEYITGRFNPEALSSREYFKEMKLK